MWRDDFETRSGSIARRWPTASQVVVAGGCDYYPGSRTSSPSFSFPSPTLRVAGEGDLLAQLERLRKALAAEGLFEPQKRAAPPGRCRARSASSPASAARRATTCSPGLRRRGWAGRLVWAFAPVQDRHAAPRDRRARCRTWPPAARST